MEIHQKPTFLPVTVKYYQDVSHTKTLIGTFSNFAIYASTGKLESDPVGVSFNVYVAQSTISFIPLKGDYLKIGSQAYQVIENPLYQKGSSVLKPYYKLHVKTITLPELA